MEVATSKTTHFTGHKAPILRVAIDPKLEYIVRIDRVEYCSASNFSELTLCAIYTGIVQLRRNSSRLANKRSIRYEELVERDERV